MQTIEIFVWVPLLHMQIMNLDLLGNTDAAAPKTALTHVSSPYLKSPLPKHKSS